MKPLRLLVGLGNPGSEYRSTRHNIGAIWVERFALRAGISLRAETRFKGFLGKGQYAEVELLLLLPTTYMNNSGAAVAAVATFYKIDPEEIMIVHDEIAFPVGTARLKTGGGTNGHNGLRDIIPALGNNDGFHRLRLGVDHPGRPEQVAAYLTSARIPAAEQRQLDDVCDFAPEVLAAIVCGDFGTAMNALHTAASPPIKGT